MDNNYNLQENKRFSVFPDAFSANIRFKYASFLPAESCFVRFSQQHAILFLCVFSALMAKTWAIRLRMSFVFTKFAIEKPKIIL